MFWGLAPLSWLWDGAPWATRVGGAVLQGVALGWLGIVTARHSLRLLLAAGVVVSATYLASNHWLLREPWNLHIPLPYFVLFLFLTHLVAIGRTRQLIAMAIVACVLVQTHIGYTLLVIAGFAYALAWVAFDARRARRLPDGWRTTVAISAGIVVLVWIPPVVDVVVNWPGNLGRIGDYFASRRDAVGFINALRYVSDEFRVVPPWLGGAHRGQFLTGFAVSASLVWLLGPAAFLLAAAVALRAARSRDDVRMVGLAALMAVVSVLAIAGADEPRAYTFQWRAVTAAFLVVTCVWAVAAAVGAHTGRVARATAIAVALGLIAWGSIAMAVSVTRRSASYLAGRERALELVMRRADRRFPPTGVVRIRSTGPGVPSLAFGVMDELDRRGVDVRVDPRLARIVGDDRALARTRPATTWYVTEDGFRIPDLLARDGARLVAAVSPLTRAEERELTELEQGAIGALRRASRPGLVAYLESTFAAIRLAGIPGLSARDLRRIDELATRVRGLGSRCWCAVIEVPAAASRG
jgi:hypothetical protein